MYNDQHKCDGVHMLHFIRVGTLRFHVRCRQLSQIIKILTPSQSFQFFYMTQAHFHVLL